MYALFENGKQISKAHFIKHTVWMEAFEKRLVYQYHYGRFLVGDYEIKEV